MNATRLMPAFFCALAVALTSGGIEAQQPAPPADITGEYALAQADDADLPIVISEEDGCRREITGATLTLGAENRWTLNARVRQTCGEEVSELAVRQHGTFSAAEEGLQFTSEPADEDAAAFDDLPLYELAPITTGRLHDSAIQVTIGEGEQVHTLVFRR